jgi:ADP-ribose pyrophosphatase YjhB (NUDIX family)
MQHSHCSYCGERFPDGAGWRRTCAGCGETTWSNPLPVAVVLLPVHWADGRTGVVVIRRDIEPFRGQLALRGRSIETGESWREAAVRELKEETGLEAQADEVQLFDVASSFNGYSLLIFAVLPPRAGETLPPSVATGESVEFLVLTEATRLCFPTHTDALAKYFAGRPRPRNSAPPRPATETGLASHRRQPARLLARRPYRVWLCLCARPVSAPPTSC